MRAPSPHELLSWPRPYAANPYLSRLASALAAQGVHTRSHRYLAALVARPRGARWLHVHWPEWMLRDASRIRARARAAWLFALLDVARARGVRLAWTAHNLLGHDEPHPDLARAARAALLARCDAVFGHFAAAEQDVRGLGFSGRFALTPHPHFAEDYPAPPSRAQARDALALAPDALVLLAFGAIEPYKGLDALAAAFVREAPPRARLLVVGRASSRSALDALRTAAAGDARVRIDAAFASPEHTARLFAAADALVLGYKAFYTSGTAVLALSLGTPVLGPPREHLATLVGRPFFIPLAGPAALPEALSQLAAMDPSARAAAAVYARSFRWEDAARVVRDTLFGGAP